MLSDPTVAFAVLVLAGIVTSVINTFAGGGSFLTLPILLAMGMPASVANGTIRPGIVVQCASSAIAFHRGGVRDFGIFARLIAPMCAGALLGARLATTLPDATLRPVFGGMFLAWGLVLVIRPGRFLHPPPQPLQPTVAVYLAAGAIGVYGGFLQAGVGFPLMALLIGWLGYPAVRGNAVKILLVLVYTLLATGVFALAGQVAWREAAALALGSLLGGWVGARWQMRSGAGLVRWFVVVMVAASGVMMLFG